MTQDLENQMVVGYDEPEPERDEDHADYMDELRREDNERLNKGLRDIGTIRFIDFKLAQAN